MTIADPIARFKKSPEVFDSFLQALSTLYNTGVYEFLRESGRVRPVAQNGPNYSEMQAAQYNWSLGFQHCLDQLFYFKEIYLTPPDMTKRTEPDYGSIDEAVEAGDLTKEEADALRNNKPIPLLERTTGTEPKRST